MHGGMRWQAVTGTAVPPLCTAQAALALANNAKTGGGVVYFPGGRVRCRQHACGGWGMGRALAASPPAAAQAQLQRAPSTLPATCRGQLHAHPAADGDAGRRGAARRRPRSHHALYPGVPQRRLFGHLGHGRRRCAGGARRQDRRRTRPAAPAQHTALARCLSPALLGHLSPPPQLCHSLALPPPFTPTGSVSSAWSFGGGFLTFKGRRQRSGNAATRLAAVNRAVQPGDTRIPVRLWRGGHARAC